MKVYAIMVGEYSDYYLDSIFLSRELAEKRCECRYPNRNGEVEILEWEAYETLDIPQDQ